MKNNCDIVRDLLPLYVDGVCSQESAKLVEEHLTDCQSCRELLDKLRGEEEIIPGSPSAAPPEDGAKVLERTARTVGFHVVRALVGIFAIVMIWMVYLWQEGMAGQGNYRYVSYGLHEIFNLVILITMAATWIWLIAVLWRIVRQKRWRRYWALALTLALLAGAQIAYFVWMSGYTAHTGVAQVLKVTDQTHVVVQIGEEIWEMETVPILSDLLEEDGTVYMIDYYTRTDRPGWAYLNYVWDIVINGQGEYTDG